MGGKRRLRVTFAGALISAFLSGPLCGQTASGTLLPTKVTQLPNQEELDAQLKSSRWRLGPLGLTPRFSIGQLGYNTNLLGSEEDEEGDWTMSAGAGADYIARLGPLYARGAAIGSYGWYAHNVERRQLGWSTDTKFYAAIRRVSMEFTGSSAQVTENLSSEEVRPVTGRSLSGGVTAEYELTRRLGLLAGFSATRLRFPTSGLLAAEVDRLRALEREEWQGVGGIQFRVTERMQVGIRYEQGKATFVREAESRNRKNTGVSATVFLGRSRLGINISGGYRKFEGGEGFPEQKGVSGGAHVTYDLTRTVTLTISAVRELQNSLFADNPYFVETRYGGSLGFRPGRFELAVAGDLGRNAYPVPGGSAGTSAKRIDDVTGLRLTLGLPVVRSLRVHATASRTYYRSNLPGFDRTIDQVFTTISLGLGGLTR